MNKLEIDDEQVAENREEQLYEVEALSEICIDEGEFECNALDDVKPTGPISGIIRCRIICDDDNGIPIKIELDNEERSQIVHNLPPIVIHFEMTSGYPSITPPISKIMCDWLNQSQIKKLEEALLQEWNDAPGEPVLFKWKDLMQVKIRDESDYLVQSK